MNYDTWKTTPPDSDPEGEHQDEDRCPDCGVGPDDACLPECRCGYCVERARRARVLREREKVTA